MRRNEITKELINLSKRAKALGFPQDVEEGDWIHDHEVTLICKDSMGYCFIRDNRWATMPEELSPEYFLVLSFSTCLKWLEKQDKDKLVGLELNNFVHGHWIMIMMCKTYRGKNIHEAIAKAVVKILEEK